MTACEGRRRYRRRTVRVLVDYATETGPRCDLATTLGAGGLFIESDDPLAETSTLKLQFSLPGSDRVHVDREHRLAPETFLALGDDDLRAVGFSRQKIAYGRILAEAVASGELDLGRLSKAEFARRRRFRDRTR